MSQTPIKSCAIALLVLVLSSTLGLSAGGPAEQFARYMFAHMGATGIDCPQEVAEKHPGRELLCAMYASDFGAFKTDWEINCRRHDLPDRVKPLSPWTLRGGSYWREYESGGAPLTFIFDSDGNLLMALFDIGEDLDTDGAVPEEAVRQAPLEPGFGGVSLPRLIPESRVEPVYPHEAKRLGLEGRVALGLIIDSDGAVEEATVLTCEPAGVGFEEAAIRAVRQWRYEPSLLEGVPVRVIYTVYIRFSRQEGL
jgi:TonB family protein